MCDTVLLCLPVAPTEVDKQWLACRAIVSSAGHDHFQGLRQGPGGSAICWDRHRPAGLQDHAGCHAGTANGAHSGMIARLPLALCKPVVKQQA